MKRTSAATGSRMAAPAARMPFWFSAETSNEGEGY